MIAWLAAAAVAHACALPDLVPAPAGADADAETCATLDLELGARGVYVTPDPGVAAQIQLTRGRAVVAAGGPWSSAVLGVGATRSGGEAGYVGVDGESMVAVVQNAEVRAAWRRGGVAASLGLIDEPWVATANRAWGLRPVAPALAQDRGWVEPYDLGGWAAWTSPGGWVTVTAVLTSGEGFRQRERNEGKDAGAVVTVRPVPGPDGDASPRLVVSGWARDGSRGLDSARDHRFGGRVTASAGPVRAGAEVLAGLGLDADASREPLGVSAWARAADDTPVAAWARVDRGWDRRDPTARPAPVVRVGGGPRLGPADGARPFYVAAGLELATYGADAAPIAGAAEAANTITALLQVAATPRLVGALALAAPVEDL